MAEKLSLEDFLLSMKLAPRLAIELLLENESSGLLLLMRDKEPFKGMWHVPGGFLLKGETFDEGIERLAIAELDLRVAATDFKFQGIFETPKEDPRGHVVHYVTRSERKLDKVSVPGARFFNNLPQDVIPFHARFLNKLGYT